MTESKNTLGYERGEKSWCALVFSLNLGLMLWLDVRLKHYIFLELVKKFVWVGAVGGAVCKYSLVFSFVQAE